MFCAITKANVGQYDLELEGTWNWARCKTQDKIIFHCLKKVYKFALKFVILRVYKLRHCHGYQEIQHNII